MTNYLLRNPDESPEYCLIRQIGLLDYGQAGGKSVDYLRGSPRRASHVMS